MRDAVSSLTLSASVPWSHLLPQPLLSRSLALNLPSQQLTCLGRPKQRVRSVDIRYLCSQHLSQNENDIA
jgi:hypothetical protein